MDPPIWVERIPALKLGRFYRLGQQGELSRRKLFQGFGGRFVSNGKQEVDEVSGGFERKAYTHLRRYMFILAPMIHL